MKPQATTIPLTDKNSSPSKSSLELLIEKKLPETLKNELQTTQYQEYDFRELIFLQILEPTPRDLTLWNNLTLLGVRVCPV
jgi:hypothetical protein